jgi:hypothetical protein
VSCLVRHAIAFAIAYTIVAVVPALLTVGTAVAKIRGLEPATSGLITAGVPRS